MKIINLKSKVLILLLISMIVLLLAGIVSYGATNYTISVNHVLGTSLQNYTLVCSQTTINTNNWGNYTFDSISKTTANTGVYSGKTITPTTAKMYVVASSNSNLSTAKSFSLSENIETAWNSFNLGLSSRTVKIYIFYNIEESAQPYQPQPGETEYASGRVKINIHYMLTTGGGGHKYKDERCVETIDESKRLRPTESRFVGENYTIATCTFEQSFNAKASDGVVYTYKFCNSHTMGTDKYMSDYKGVFSGDHKGAVSFWLKDPTITGESGVEYIPNYGSKIVRQIDLKGNKEINIIAEYRQTGGGSAGDSGDYEPPPYIVEPEEPYIPPEPEDKDWEKRTSYKLEHLNPIAKAIISSDDMGAEEYNNLHIGNEYFGIPTSKTQYCILEITFNLYRLGYDKVEGAKFYDVTVATEYSYPYTEKNADGVDVQKTGTYTVERVYRYERKYEYYELTAYDAYQLIKADVVNDTLTEAGRITMYEADLSIGNGATIYADHMSLTLDGVETTGSNMKIKLTRTVPDKVEARLAAARELGVDVNSLYYGNTNTTKDTKNRASTKAEGHEDVSNSIWKEASEKTILTVWNDEIYHGGVYMMEESRTSTDNENDIAVTKSPAENANQNVLNLARYYIRIPTTVPNEEYKSHIEGYYQKAPDNLIEYIRAAGVQTFPEDDIPGFLKL